MTDDQGKRRRIKVEDRRQRGADSDLEPDVAAERVIDERLSEFIAAGADTLPAAEVMPPAEAAGGRVPEKTAEEWRELALRKEAELQNYRKRVLSDMDDARRYAVESLLSDLFPVLDGLAQATAAYQDAPDGENALLDGLRRSVRVLEHALTKHGITKIAQAGVPFDPNLHQPLHVEEVAGAEGETVAEVYVEGYLLGELVLKPAMVKVVKPLDS